MYDELIKLTTEEKVLYAIACAKLYCQKKKIAHASIDEWLEHLGTMLTTNSLIEWNDKIGCLTFSGLGDPLPPELADVVPFSDQEEFDMLTTYVTDIGRCDLFLAVSDCPLEVLTDVVEIIKANDIALPVPSKFKTGVPTHFSK